LLFLFTCLRFQQNISEVGLNTDVVALLAVQNGSEAEDEIGEREA